MINKQCSLDKIEKLYRDGLTIMVGGFAFCGAPFALLDALFESGATDLTIIKTVGHFPGMGVERLIRGNRVKKLIASHIGVCPIAMEKLNKGELEVDFYPMGILAEKIRAGGAGHYGFLTDVGIDTILRKNKAIVEFDGKELIVEQTLRADLALIHAAVGDTYGNLFYNLTARNINPLMATASDLVLAQVEKLVDVGEMTSDVIHTSGAFVDHIYQLDKITPEYFGEAIHDVA